MLKVQYLLKTYRENFWDRETHVKDLVGLFFRQELKILFPFPKLSKLEGKQQLYCDSSLVLCNYKCVSDVCPSALLSYN